MKLFITGGLGFIGSNYILNRLDDPDVEILNYDKVTYAGNPDNLLSIKDNDKYKFVKGDICDQKLLLKSITDFAPDVIINFAAESHVDRSIDSPLDFINTLGSSALSIKAPSSLKVCSVASSFLITFSTKSSSNKDDS